MTLKSENALFLPARHSFNLQDIKISFEYVDSYAKLSLTLDTTVRNSKTQRTIILLSLHTIFLITFIIWLEDMKQNDCESMSSTFVCFDIDSIPHCFQRNKSCKTPSQNLIYGVKMLDRGVAASKKILALCLF